MLEFDLGKVAVLMGGSSSERAISLKSGSSVLTSLLASGVNAVAFDPQEQSLDNLKKEAYDRAFIALHGKGGEDGAVQSVLDYFNIPYTGSSALACGITMNKVLCKNVWGGIGLPTPKHHLLLNQDFATTDFAQVLADLGGKVFIKPAKEGSSIGIFKADSASKLQANTLKALEYDDQILIEQEMTGDEFTVSFLGDMILPSVKLQVANDFYDFDAKYNSSSTVYHCPSGLNETREIEIANIAKQAFEALGMSGWGRADLMLDANGDFNLLEVNSAPGMTSSSLVPLAAKERGISFDELVLLILNQTKNQP